MTQIYNQTSYKSVGIWQKCGTTQISSIGVVGGNESNGEPLYVGRAMQSGDCIPGKVCMSHGVCYVAYGGREHSNRDYQVLTNPNKCDLIWAPITHSNELPFGAIQGGQQRDGQKLFIGRANHNGSMVIGKVHPGHKTLYISFNGEEVSINKYEVLVCREICH